MQYVWLIWAAAFLAPWIALYAALPSVRGRMWRASWLTMPFGLTEPIFVPEYWNPPSLFDLAQRTGFDLESLIFCFAIGGIGSVIYAALSRIRPRLVPHDERHQRRHRYHGLALLGPVAAFPLLYALPWNPIYPAIAALLTGAAGTVVCRPDLARNSMFGAAAYTLLYWIFMLGLDITAPGYIQAVWRLDELSGFVVLGAPLEELLFGFAFGAYWASAYEHLAWQTMKAARRSFGDIRNGHPAR